MEQSPTQETQHPGDVFFQKLGLPEGFGEGTITFHGREIERRDYFLQPDVHPLARRSFEILSAMDKTDPNFPAYREAFLAGAAPYLGTIEG